MNACHVCGRPVTRYRRITDRFGLRVIVCLICSPRYDR